MPHFLQQGDFSASKDIHKEIRQCQKEISPTEDSTDELARKLGLVMPEKSESEFGEKSTAQRRTSDIEAVLISEDPKDVIF